MAAVMLCLRKNLQKPDRAFQCSPSFFPSACILATSLPDADRALPFLSSSSSISYHLPCPPSCRHLAQHQCRPPTFPILSFFPFSLSAHRHHPYIRPLSLTSDHSLSASALSTVAAFSPSPPPSASSSIVVDTTAASSLSSLLLFLCLPNILLWVISASARTSMDSKLVALDPHLHSSVPSLFSPSASAPSSLIDAAAVASFTAAFLIPPPLMSSPPPYSPSLPCLPTSNPRGSSSASAAVPSRLRLHPLPQPWTRAGDGHQLGEDVGVSLILFSFWAGNGLKLYLVGWVGLAYWAKYGLGWPVG